MLKHLWLKFRSSFLGERVRSSIPSQAVNLFKHLPLAVLAAVWYRFPARKLIVIGVTGTDGKTTTASLIHHLLTTGGKKAALISTITAKVGDEEISTGLHVTSPRPWQLQQLIKKIADRGYRYLVLEVTSHGLDQHRVWGIPFKIGVLTNVSYEHLDYHSSYEDYLRAKEKLLNRAERVIVNKDDSSFKKLKVDKPESGIITYGIRNKADFIGADIVLSPTLARFTCKCMDTTKRGEETELKIKTKLLGEYNVSNSLAAIACTSALGLKDQIIQKGLADFRSPEGRMEFVNQGQPFSVIIDFAHTPNALENVLETCRAILSPRRLIVVFGCAGLRDKQKRPVMGEIAANLADLTVLTAEDPRSEDLKEIIDQIAQGCLKRGAVEQKPDKSNLSLTSPLFFRIPDRQEAINFAVQKLAKKGDTVLVTGKGHEQSMCFGTKEHPWSDKKAVVKALAPRFEEEPTSKVGVLHVHFMGIGGSGMSAVAAIALNQGYQVSGCDLVGKTNYTRYLAKKGVKIFKGHGLSHLEGVDLLAVTPGVFDLSADNPELIEGQKRGMVLTWQNFMGDYLQKDRFVLAVTGTHGKTTTTAALGLALEAAGWDPTVELGALVPQWGTNFRLGKSKYFVCEADEFNDNFLNYHPRLTILTNIEMDHPEFFKDFDNVVASFAAFVKGSKGKGILVADGDDPGVRRILAKELKDWPGKVVKYSLSQWKEEAIPLQLMGDHNKRNVLGVIAACRVLGIKKEAVEEALQDFSGADRRMELAGEIKGVKIFDDYAHHPTQVKATLEGAREAFPQARIWAVFQPHMFSRTKVLLNDFQKAFQAADEVIVVDIFASREAKERTRQTVHSRDVVGVIENQAKRYLGDLKEAARFLARKVEEGNVIICMGAGDVNRVFKWLSEEMRNLR